MALLTDHAYFFRMNRYSIMMVFNDTQFNFVKQYKRKTIVLLLSKRIV